MIYKYGIGEHVYIIENGMHIKEVIIVNIANGFYQVCFTDRKGSIKLRESRLYKTIGEAATKNSAAKNELSKLHKKKIPFTIWLRMWILWMTEKFIIKN